MQIHGTLRQLRVHSHSWAFGKIVPMGHDCRPLQELFAKHDLPFTGEVAVCGEALVNLRVDGTYAMECEFSIHPVYGAQLKVFTATAHMGSGNAQLAAYLEQNFQGVGSAIAKKAVAWFEEQGRLDEFRDYVQSNPVEIDLTRALGRQSPAIYKFRETRTFFEVIARTLSREHLQAQVRPGAWSGLGKKLGMRNDKAWQRYVEMTQRLSAEDAKQVPLPPILADKLDAAIRQFRDNPYEAIAFRVRNYGFDEADRVGALLGIEADDPRRLSALGEEAVFRRCRAAGHTYLTYAQFVAAVAKMDPTVSADEVLAQSRRSVNEPLVLDEGRVYVKSLLQAEVTAARALQNMLVTPGRPLGRSEGMSERLRELEETTGISLDPSQREALLALLQSETRIHTLTAGPGRGKTTVVQMLVAEAEVNGKVGLFAAPTGKAAKVLSERLGRAVTTIHRMLGPDPGSEDGFKYGISRKLQADFVVIDEASMMDIELAQSVFSAVDDHAHLILLGDPGQLPSVGPGAVLADVLRLEADRHTLHQTHRNNGHILQLIDEVGAGALKHVPVESDVVPVVPQGSAVQEALHHLIELYLDNVQQRQAAFEQDRARAQALVHEGAENEGEPVFCEGKSGFESVCLITPRRTGHAQTPGWNATYLNSAIQARVNPSGEKVPGMPFVRVGDRVLVRQNVYAGGDREVVVVNGDTGELLGYELNDKKLLKSIRLRLDTGETVTVSAANLDSPEDIDRVIDLGYCLTVHAAQGSEYDTVIFALQNSSVFVDRRMVYTAISRAKRKLVIYGMPSALVEAARVTPSVRQSRLVERAEASSQVAELLLRAKKGW